MHMNYCAFCARSKNVESNAICKCAHCPRVFHTDCMEEKGINKGTGMFICPHHKCASCTRSTAAAGGLLFRCMGCLTSYCEDCLPQDEIESIGRCRDMEELGYDSKQSYYILCPSCCVHDGVTAKGVVGDQVADDGDEADDEEDDDDEEDEDDEAPTPSASHNGRNGETSSSASRIKEESSLLPSQLMRVVWEEEPDSEEERQEKLRISREVKKAEKERIKQEEKERKIEEMADAERKRLLKEKEKEKKKDKHKGKDSKGKGKVEVVKKGRKSQQPVEESSDEEEIPQKRGRASLKGDHYLYYQCLWTTQCSIYGFLTHNCSVSLVP